ncbi:MAG: NAD(P)/FAD-dependent oxidoreductase, partial [Pseudomonadota bacterium]
MNEIETDYLVIGAGASAMAFVDTLIAGSDADIVMVERRHQPGGHWNDAYPFVRIHHCSANYGCNSTMLGTNAINATGPDAGMYERANSVEVCAYFQRVLETVLLASGQVRLFEMYNYVAIFIRERSLCRHYYRSSHQWLTEKDGKVT